MERRADAELIARASRGDVTALGALYDEHAPILLGIARRMLRGVEEAEDLVHDVFLEAWRRANDFDPNRGSVRTWLVLRTRSRALDRLKSGHARKVVRQSDENEPEPESGGLTVSPDRTRVRVAIAQLPDDQRDVLLLGYFAGMSSSEIALHLSIPVGTVKSRTAAGLKKLRSALDAEAV